MKILHFNQMKKKSIVIKITNYINNHQRELLPRRYTHPTLKLCIQFYYLFAMAAFSPAREIWRLEDRPL